MQGGPKLKPVIVGIEWLIMTVDVNIIGGHPGFCRTNRVVFKMG